MEKTRGVARPYPGGRKEGKNGRNARKAQPDRLRVSYDHAGIQVQVWKMQRTRRRIVSAQ